MKRSVLSLLIGLALLGASPPAHAVSALLMGAAQSLNLDSLGYVSNLSVNVKNGWLNGDTFYLDIVITSVNWAVGFHGQTCVPVSASELFGADRDVAEVVIDWTGLDVEPHEDGNGEIFYTADVLIRVDGCDGHILTAHSTTFSFQ